MLVIRSVLIGAIGLLFSSPAQANWKYTDWGMTPIKVAEASNEDAKVSSGRPGQKMDGYDIGAVGIYKTSSHTFGVIFYFKSGYLALVRLEASSDCALLLNQLKSNYGQPNFDNQSSIVRQITWKDIQGGNTVNFDGMDSSSCSITYEPLAGNTGL